MRVVTLLALCLTLFAPFANAQIAPAQSTIATMDDPSENWFIKKTSNGGYIFDAISGEMQGLVSLSRHTPAGPPNPPSPRANTTASMLATASPDLASLNSVPISNSAPRPSPLS